MQVLKLKLLKTAHRAYALKLQLLGTDGEVSSQTVSLTDVDLVQLALDVSTVVQDDRSEVTNGY